MRRYKGFKFLVLSLALLVLSSFSAGVFSGMGTRLESGIYYASVCMIIMTIIGTIISAIYIGFESERR